MHVVSSQPFRSLTQFRTLIAAVRDEPGAQELDWVEWKSEVDLHERLWRARASKFILGAANRPLPRAAQHASGCAYLLLGVGPGRLPGTTPIDPASLEQGLRQYLGADGPVWSPQVVPIDGVMVVVITVEPTPPTDVTASTIAMLNDTCGNLIQLTELARG